MTQKRKRAKIDRAGLQIYEINYLADKFGLREMLVRAIVKKFGRSRSRVIEEIRKAAA